MTQAFAPMTRADPAKMRQAYARQIPGADRALTGLDHPVGARHPRAWVGPPHLYDLIGAMQFQLLVELGCRDHHRVLDIGCGSLRLGQLVIPYLLPDRYFGVEPEAEILDQGVQMHFGAPLDRAQVIAHKRPRFRISAEFAYLDLTGGPVDFIFAQSIASHTGPDMTRDLLRAIAQVCHPDTIAMVTFIRCDNPENANRTEGWVYPECVTYTDADFGGFARDAGLYAYRAAWPAMNIRADGLISSQQPTILTRRPWRPALAQRMTAALFEGILPLDGPQAVGTV